MKPVAPKAFVSWAHAGEDWDDARIDQWGAEVREFCYLLRRLGIDVDADFFHVDEPGINWGTFGPRAIGDADFTIVVVSSPWAQRWEGRNDTTLGAGAAAEANALRGIFQRDQADFSRRVVLVELPSSDRGAVPADLSGFQRKRVSEFTVEGCEDLLRLLTGSPRYPLPPLGSLPLLPPTTGATRSRAASSDEVRSEESPSEARQAVIKEAEASAGLEDQVASARELLNRLGKPRTPATRPGAGSGRVPGSKGRTYPADPVTATDVRALLEHLAGARTKYENRPGELSRVRLSAMIAVLYRTGLRIREALDLESRDVLRASGCLRVRHGNRGASRVVAMDPWGWTYLDAWLRARSQLPPGPLFCVVGGVTAGAGWQASDVRRQLHDCAEAASVGRRVAPQQFRHAHALELWNEGIDLGTIQQQLGSSRRSHLMRYILELTPDPRVKAIGEREPPQAT